MSGGLGGGFWPRVDCDGGLLLLFPAMQSLPPSLGPCVDGQALGGQTPMPFALLVNWQISSLDAGVLSSEAF